MADIGALFNQGSQIGAGYVNNAAQNQSRIATLQQRQAELLAQQGQKIREQYIKVVEDMLRQLPDIAKNNPQKIGAARKSIESVLTSQVKGPGGQPIMLAQLAGVDVANVLQQADIGIASAADPRQAGVNAGQTQLAQAPYTAQATGILAPAEARAAGMKTAAEAKASNEANPTSDFYINPESGKSMAVNSNDPVQVSRARLAGYVKAPLSVQASKVGDLEDTDIGKIFAARDRAMEAYKSTGNPTQLELANKLDNQIAYGKNGPPAAIVQAKNAHSEARRGLADLYDLYSRGASSLIPEDRQELAAAMAHIKSAFGQLLQRGANFTESEQEMIRDQVGGDPNAVFQRALRSDESYKKLIIKAAEVVEERMRELDNEYRRPTSALLKGDRTYQYPWEKQGRVIDFNDYPG